MRVTVDTGSAVRAASSRVPSHSSCAVKVASSDSARAKGITIGRPARRVARLGSRSRADAHAGAAKSPMPTSGDGL